MRNRRELAKSVIFAVSHRHALELCQSFNRLHPDLQRRGLARIIDSHMELPEIRAVHTQLAFALSQAILNRARIASLENLHQAPFNRIGDPERLFAPAELDEILGLAHSLAA